MKENRAERKGRRVGTLTLGVTLVVMGILFLLRLVGISWISAAVIFHCWPVVLILLGVEVLLSYVINKEEKMYYDGWGIFLIITMVGFATTMAVLEVLFSYGQIGGDVFF